MEESEHYTNNHSGGSDMGLSHSLQRIQECSNRRTFSPIQTGLGLIKGVSKQRFPLFRACVF